MKHKDYATAEALEKEAEVRYKKKDKKKRPAMRINGGRVKHLQALIKNKK